ncbi:hypothetical protein J6590_048611 [Homalodisca vitripennis]|nr:hypothetical protein J6590_048611 [Homalodisca vitripennis]
MRFHLGPVASVTPNFESHPDWSLVKDTAFQVGGNVCNVFITQTVINNQCDRDNSSGRRSDAFDNRQMRWLWRQIQRFEQRRNTANTSTTPREDGELPQSSPVRGSMGTSSSSDEDAETGRPQCSPS